MALLGASLAITVTGAKGDLAVIAIVRLAVQTPTRQIASNAGAEALIVAGKILDDREATFGLDPDVSQWLAAQAHILADIGIRSFEAMQIGEMKGPSARRVADRRVYPSQYDLLTRSVERRSLAPKAPELNGAGREARNGSA
ncbi:hypothetical protein MPL3365_170078 [Mesorhizobium plurifarium]|uniref:Uncharacterized protein n=1 Tax=Mesorhizobium plurifarium TaxID=69974 RepID=A0A090FYS9_MESPL|nr:hypothetical protein MPL3365_170078 [Mesorhizobium plurifarium]